jgi:hypothetical protein
MLRLKNTSCLPDSIVLIEKPDSKPGEGSGQVVCMYKRDIRLLSATLEQVMKPPAFLVRPDKCPTHQLVRADMQRRYEAVLTEVCARISTEMAQVSEVIHQIRKVEYTSEITPEQFEKFKAVASEFTVVKYSGNSLDDAHDLNESKMTGGGRNKRTRSLEEEEAISTTSDEEERGEEETKAAKKEE